MSGDDITAFSGFIRGSNGELEVRKKTQIETNPKLVFLLFHWGT